VCRVYLCRFLSDLIVRLAEGVFSFLRPPHVAFSLSNLLHKYTTIHNQQVPQKQVHTNTQSTFFPPFSLPLLFFIVIIRLSVWTLVRNEREREKARARAQFPFTTTTTTTATTTRGVFQKKKSTRSAPTGKKKKKKKKKRKRKKKKKTGGGRRKG